MFEPKGPRPVWAPIYDLLVTGEIGRTFSYTELSAAAGHNIQDCGSRSDLYAAIRALEAGNKRTAECVVNVGYRIVHPSEHRAIGLGHQRKARRSVNRGLRKVRAADVDLLTPEQRRANDAVMAQLDSHQRMLINHEGRILRVERAQASMEQAARRRDALALEELRRNLEHLGISVTRDRELPH